MLLFDKKEVLLEKTNHLFESKAVLNPAVYQDGNVVHLFYRAVDKNNVSSIGYCRIEDQTRVVERSEKPLLVPEFEYERMGMEDPRITKIDDTYYMVYVAYDGKNARIAYATSKDLKTFKKHGIISPNITYRRATDLFGKSRLKDGYHFFSAHIRESLGEDCFLWEKDSYLMPKKFNGKFALVHRVLPEIQIIFFNDFKELQDESFWENYLSNLNQFVAVETSEWFEMRNIGAGCVALETYAGWLMLYHGVYESNKRRTYCIGAALMDTNNPLQLVAKFRDPVFIPTEEWELSGEVTNTVFPTGVAVFDNELRIYYGAADERIGTASMELDNFLRALIQHGAPRDTLTPPTYM